MKRAFVIGILALCFFGACASIKRPLPDFSSHAERPTVTGKHPSIDLTKWAGRTYNEMDKLFSDFSLNYPPVIGPYGICSSITFLFPVKDSDAKIKKLICNLDEAYAPSEALQLLGFPGDAPGERRDDELTFASLNDRVSYVTCLLLEANTSMTKHVEVTFNRNEGNEDKD